MNDIKLKFDIPIDASLLSFKFKDASFAEVKYSLDNATKEVFVYAIECAPIVLKTIANMPEFVRQCEAAAKHNAATYLQQKAKEQGQTADLVASLSNINEHFRGALAGLINH